jgi:hypothetical protein
VLPLTIQEVISVNSKDGQSFSFDIVISTKVNDCWRVDKLRNALVARLLVGLTTSVLTVRVITIARAQQQRPQEKN